jgi:hypothetical protein
MPYKDPEVRRAKNREYSRTWKARNRDKLNERRREQRELEPERFREYQQNYRARNADKIRERSRVQSRAHYEKNREQRIERQREYNALNRDEIRARDRQRYRSGGAEKMRAWRLWFKHGMRPEDWAALWDAQDGRCYLCGDEMAIDKAVIEHDHSHCPAEQSCRVCRRGLACANCNSAIGMVADDPARLRRMADALEAAQARVDKRKNTETHEQLAFG